MATWIVGIDGSDNARHALEWAVRMAEGRDVQIKALGSWHVEVAGDMWRVGAPNIDELVQLHAAEVARLVGEVDTRGVTVTVDTIQGPAAAALIDASETADLLVVGGRGMGRIRGALMGSVSHRCVNHANVPVAVIPGDAALPPLRNVLVGFDQSDHATAALRWAIDNAPADADVIAIGAYDKVPWLHEDIARQRHADEIDQAETEFRDSIAAIDPAGRVTARFVVADPRVALAQAGEDHDLVVLGARGRGALGGAVLGSVSSWMLHNARRAIVVVR